LPVGDGVNFFCCFGVDLGTWFFWCLETRLSCFGESRVGDKIKEIEKLLCVVCGIGLEF